jgi:hypothetical protein
VFTAVLASSLRMITAATTSGRNKNASRTIERSASRELHHAREAVSLGELLCRPFGAGDDFLPFSWGAHRREESWSPRLNCVAASAAEAGFVKERLASLATWPHACLKARLPRSAVGDTIGQWLDDHNSAFFSAD